MLGTTIAEAQSVSLARIKALTAELGYKPSATSDMVTLEAVGSHQSDIKFILADDKSRVLVFSNWSIPAEKQTAIPALDMLKASSSSPFAFAVYGKDGDLSFDLEATYDASTVNKAMLRRTIDLLLETIDTNEALWNTDKWPLAKPAAVSAEKTYAAAQAEADLAWERSPLTVKRALLTGDHAKDFGAYSERAGVVFKHGETAFIYLEPNGYEWGPEKDGVYRFGTSVDIGIQAKAIGFDVTIPGFAQLVVSNKNKLKNLYLTIDLTLKDTLPVGDYVLTLTLHDINNTAKVATAQLPLVIRN